MSAPSIVRDADADRAYVTWRIIDCCLREDVRGLVARGAAATPTLAIARAWASDGRPTLWWRVDHLPAGVLWLPVRYSDAMQSLSALSDGWVRESGDGVALEYGAERWLELIGQDLDEQTRALHRDYAAEAACAAQHRALARAAYVGNATALTQALDLQPWTERALRLDQVASYRDHPFYPTARAKSGFDEAALRGYAPEFDPSFELRWLAVPKAALTLTTPQPGFWPGWRELGLPASVETSHALMPVHPLTWSRLDEFELPADTLRAPNPFLRVRPTLSVRTVMPVEHPRHHLKLPLLMRTLGALNLRLIKPSTLYDGHWFQRVLSQIGVTDAALRGRFVHVDESHGGHVDEAKHLAYLLRSYPESLDGGTLVPVAALCGAMPDGRALARHLADRYYAGDLSAWWRDYARLLCEVHLRLWLSYGVALESNQQNAVLIYRDDAPPRLLMKDNDSARVLQSRLRSRLAGVEAYGPVRDARIEVESDDALARMFCTITLQLCLLAVLEGVAEGERALRAGMYAALRETLSSSLRALAAEGIDTAPAWALLRAPRLPVKYLLSAGSLYSKAATGAADINKFYGDSGPNFMLAGDDPAAPSNPAEAA
ncbi:IucA/IucC family protein [Pseudomonas sp. CGJS7]|uniref:IucA/IucC family protein n=1 Tax=Pseudomonas sp. CGJS7 TaxID=3109348 RepID=UPI00300B74A4